jgi:hypothetical protein
MTALHKFSGSSLFGDLSSMKPAAVEDNLLILLLVDVAEVDGVEVLEKVLESDPEAAIVKCFPI